MEAVNFIGHHGSMARMGAVLIYNEGRVKRSEELTVKSSGSLSWNNPLP
jgi:hypothetical protein